LITVRKANISDSNSLVALSKQLGYETNEDFLIKRFETLKNRQQEVIVAEINNLVFCLKQTA